MAASQKVCVVIPPMTQVNTPYPSAPYLTAWLRQLGVETHQHDLSLALALRCFSPQGITDLCVAVAAHSDAHMYQSILEQQQAYVATIDTVIAFVQGKDLSLAEQLVQPGYVPQGPRSGAVDSHDFYREDGYDLHDHARMLATQMLLDLVDCWHATIAPEFSLTAYGERIAESASSYDSLATWLAVPADPLMQILEQMLESIVAVDDSMLVITCPFPGNVPAALRIGQWCKQHRPQVQVVLGGGYPSTELRDLQDARIGAVLDAIVLDDGEEPLRRMINGTEKHNTYTFENNVVHWHYDAKACPVPFKERPAPDYSGLPLDDYLDLLDTVNPMHRLWNEGQWIKLIAAHGCYWKKCSFCDTTLPYIADYDPLRAQALADFMDQLHEQTGQNGFHLTDEAAPPAVLVGLALELLRRGRSYRWWGNIRFDRYFTVDRCRLLAAAGLCAVSGGVEVAEPSVLERVGKGVDIPQVSAVTGSFAAAGILVHAYLMYGFPGQTVQHTIDSMEIVRQLMAAEFIQSGFWHRFTVTAHSAIGQNPAEWGVVITGPEFQGFARNNLMHRDATDEDHDRLTDGLNNALGCWMRGEELDQDVRAFFHEDIAQTLPEPYVEEDALEQWLAHYEEPAGLRRACWLGGALERTADGLTCIDIEGDTHHYDLDQETAQTLRELLVAASPLHWQQAQPPQMKSYQELPEWCFDCGLVLV